jgi:hypothetical protein
MPHRCYCPQGACSRDRASQAQWSPRSPTDEQAMNRPCQRHQNDRRALLAQLPTRLAPNARAHGDSRSDSAPRSAIMPLTRAHKRKRAGTRRLEAQCASQCNHAVQSCKHAHTRATSLAPLAPNAQLKQLQIRGQERGERPRELVATQVTTLRGRTWSGEKWRSGTQPTSTDEANTRQNNKQQTHVSRRSLVFPASPLQWRQKLLRCDTASDEHAQHSDTQAHGRTLLSPTAPWRASRRASRNLTHRFSNAAGKWAKADGTVPVS